MENIKRHILELYPEMSAQALEALTFCMKPVVMPAKTRLIEAHRKEQKVYFVEKGLTRSYVLHNGREVTTWFTPEGEATCSSLAMLRNKVGFEYVETVEECQLFSILSSQLEQLYRQYIDIANWMRVLQQENFLRLQDTHIVRLNLKARERYEYFLKTYPGLLQRANLGYIASFLGITQQSLSRIRAQFAGKG